MKTTHRVLIILCMAVVSGLLAYWLSTRGRHAAPGRPPAGTQPAPEAVLRSSELSHAQGGKLAWKVIIDEMQLDKGGATVAARGLREALIYDGSGRPIIRVTARQVQGDTTRRNFRVTGQVVVTSPRGMVIKTEAVDWVNDQQQIRCPGQVLMKDKSLVISTTGLDYLVGPEVVKCPNQVRVYSGNNRMVGGSLNYDAKTGTVDILDGLQMMINPEEARQVLKEWSNR